MKEVLDLLLSKSDASYADFQSRLIPNIQRATVLGVRLPDVRKIGKCVSGSDARAEFMKELPHEYYDENILHGVLISQNKDFGSTIKELNEFLPCVDNWAVCDTVTPKVFAKHKQEALPYVLNWTLDARTYVARFGIRMLMAFYLEEDFCPEYIKIVASKNSEDYYLKMAVAWFMATALAKQWNSTFPYLKDRAMSPWVHNKTIQKAEESFRITNEQKRILRENKI